MGAKDIVISGATALLWWFRAAGLHVLFAVSPRTRHRGFLIVAPLAEARDVKQLFDKIQAAIDLITQVDQRWLARLAVDLKRIIVVAGGGEVFQPRVGYLADHKALQRRPVVEVASAIVHEGTHARLYSHGIRYTSSIRDRVERTCVHQEIVFLLRIAGTEQLIKSKSDRAAHGGWWSEGDLYQRRADQMAAHGLPQWLIRLHRRLLGPQHTHHRKGES